MIHQVSFDIAPVGGFAPRVSYYAILGAVYGFFPEEMVNNVVAIKHRSTSQKMIVTLTFADEKYLHICIELLFGQQRSFFLSKKEYTIHQIDFHMKKFVPGSYTLQKKYTCSFYSPTYIHRGGINMMLPNPETFLMSVRRKLSRYYPPGVYDDVLVKNILKYNMLVGEYSLKTKRVEIKGGIRAGVVGYVTYYPKEIPDEYASLFADIFAAIPFVGIGAGTRLGLGSCGVKW